jgi:hypothetical protein
MSRVIFGGFADDYKLTNDGGDVRYVGNKFRQEL